MSLVARSKDDENIFDDSADENSVVGEEEFQRMRQHQHDRASNSKLLLQDLPDDAFDFGNTFENGPGVVKGEGEQILLAGIVEAQELGRESLVFMLRGQLFMLQAEYEKAIEQLESALIFYAGEGDGNAWTPSSATPHIDEDCLSRDRSISDSSFVGSTASIDLSPHIYSLLIECYYAQELWKRAVSVAREFIAKYPDAVTAHCTLAWCLRQDNQLRDAVEAASLGISTLPPSEGLIMLHDIRGKCLYDLGDYKKAVADFQRAVELSNMKELPKFKPKEKDFLLLQKAPRRLEPHSFVKPSPQQSPKARRRTDTGKDKQVQSPPR